MTTSIAIPFAIVLIIAASLIIILRENMKRYNKMQKR